MDIIDILIEDHVRLRKDLVRLRQNLAHHNLREQVKSFIANYELHESIEDEILFPSLAALLKNLPPYQAAAGYEKMHEKIWELMGQLVDALGTVHFEELQKVFFNFAASTEAHFGYEERILFPTIRILVSEETLKDLGRIAKERFDRFVLR